MLYEGERLCQDAPGHPKCGHGLDGLTPGYAGFCDSTSPESRNLKDTLFGL